MTAPSIRKVVLAPNLIGAALIDPAARRVLEAWRDGKIVVVTNRELIVQHLRALNRLGLPPELVKRWMYWLGSLEKALFLDKQFGATASPITLCEELANAAKADAIICWKFPSAENGLPWLPAEGFLPS